VEEALENDKSSIMLNQLKMNELKIINGDIIFIKGK